MSFLITRRPEKLFSGSIKFSRWTALSNPYIFELTRADFTVFNTAVRSAYNATKPTIWLTGTDPAIVAALFVAGDRIYLNSGVYNGVYTVFSVSGVYVTIDTPNIGTGGAGRVNIIERIINFKAYINVYDGVTNALIDTTYPKPDSTGLLVNDVSGIIRSIVDTQASANLSSINRANKGISGSFKIGYGATYKTLIGADVFDIELPEVPSSPEANDKIYYWASAARQIDGDTSLGMDGIGQNLKDYVPKDLVGSEAKFLTMFERPTYFEGFPFSLSFIYDEDFKGVYLERHQQDIDVNGTSVGAETNNNLLVSERGYVNQVKNRAVNSGASAFDFWLETGDVVVGGYTISGGLEAGTASAFALPYIP